MLGDAEELQTVIPYHGDKFNQILTNSTVEGVTIPSHDLSFCTSFIIAVLFLMVKASRPMTYQHLTVEMVTNIREDGIIDQTVFKTQDKYGFDSLIFSKETLDILKRYITCVRKRLNPQCNYLLISRNGNQLTRLSDIFGRIVFQAIGKYINPTRYRQIIETESSQNLSLDDQSYISEDQKHTSLVAQVHYKKLHSRSVAQKAKESMNKLRDESSAVEAIKRINSSILVPAEQLIRNNVKDKTDFSVVSSTGDASGRNEKKSYETTKANRQKKIPFSEIEDNCLQQGIKKYGGKWTKILEDPSLLFHTSRKPATLCIRAKNQNFY